MDKFYVCFTHYLAAKIAGRGLLVIYVAIFVTYAWIYPVLKTSATRPSYLALDASICLDVKM